MKRMNRDELLNITFYIMVVTMSFIGYGLLYTSLYKVNIYYLFIIIPVLFLCFSLGISNLFKIIFTLLIMGLKKNGNYTTVDLMYRIIDGVNVITKYVLVAIFITLLSSIMLLDIMLCIIKDKMNLLAYSIIIWVLIYYVLFNFIKIRIKKNVRD